MLTLFILHNKLHGCSISKVIFFVANVRLNKQNVVICLENSFDISIKVSSSFIKV